MESERYTGKITSYYRDRGYGFIAHDLPIGKRLFFHFTHLEYGKDSVLYARLSNSDDTNIFPPILVSFELGEGEKGYIAVNIRSEEAASGSIDKIIAFFESGYSVKEGAANRFANLVSMALLPSIDQHGNLRQLILQRIADSSQRWEDLIELAQEWLKVHQIFKRPVWSRNEEQLLNSFANTLAQCLMLQSMSGYRSYHQIPAFFKPVDNSNSPLRLFRECENITLIIALNFNSFMQSFQEDPIHDMSKPSTAFFLIFLEETEQEISLEYLNPRLWVIRQETIINTFFQKGLENNVAFGRLFREILPMRWLQPYEVGSSYKASIFVGRVRERAAILEKEDSNFAIYGGRKIGKTWFLKEICNSCESPPYNPVYTSFYVSLQSAENIEDAASMILDVLHSRLDLPALPDSDVLISLRNTLLEIHRTTKKTVLLALDELDDVLKTDKQFRLFGKLRQLQQTYPKAFKFIFAGFKELIHAFSDENSNNPFANWFGKNHRHLGCLSEQELRSLVIEPLKWVGLEFNDEAIVAKIFELTSGHPYYSQSLCHSLVNARLHIKANVLLPQNIDKLATEEFFDDVFDIFKSNLSYLQKLIGKIYVGNEDAFTDSDIASLLQNRFGIGISEKQIREEMKVLQSCSVFIRHNGGYRPLMQKINHEYFSQQDDFELALDYLENADGI